MRRVACMLALCAAMFAAEKTPVSREAMAAIERNTDGAIRGLNVTEPYDLLGFTRGVYLPGYGVVLSAELNLVLTPMTPFSKPPVGEQLNQLRLKKIQRLTPIRNLMREQMVLAASTFEAVPANENIVFALTLFYRNFEQREGLPLQIIMQASKQALVDFKAGRTTRAELDAAIQVREL